MIRKDKVINYSEELFKRKYPNAYAYLLKNKKELEKGMQINQHSGLNMEEVRRYKI